MRHTNRPRTDATGPAPASGATQQGPGGTGSRQAAAAVAVPGLSLCLVIAVAATAAGQLAPVVGAPVIGILTGAVWRLVAGARPAAAPGVRVATGFVLQSAVVVLGAQLSLTEVARAGYQSLPVMLGTLVACLLVASVVGRRLGIDRDLRTLIGVGTAICGASAIAAVSPVIRARSDQVAYAVSTIFLFNVAAVLVFPPLGHALGMSQTDFGLFAGTAVNDTSSVVATASAYGQPAADHAVVVKLVRTLMIIPISLALAFLVHRRDEGTGFTDRGARVSPFRLVPWFLIGFLVMAAANTAGLIPASSHRPLSNLALFLITTALAGIGLSTDVAELRRAGPKPMLLGLVLWVTVAGASLLLQSAPVL